MFAGEKREPAVPLDSHRPKLVPFLLVGAWIAMAAGVFQPFYLKIFTIDIPELRARWTELPYRKAPGFRRAIEEMGRRTPEGSRILLWTPHPTWEGGYYYTYRRAQYLLAGRDVLPRLVPGRDVTDAGNFSAAQFIACWPRCPSTPPGFAVVWRGESGMLLSRTPGWKP